MARDPRERRFDAVVVNSPTAPRSATPYQIKQEAKRRGLWFDVLLPGLQADPDVYEDFLISKDISIEHALIDYFAEMVRGDQELGEFKDDFFRQAVARTFE